MRDRHFMEDENELPYLLWETMDDNRRNSRSSQLELNFEDIPFKEFPSYVKRLVLPQNHKNNIINSVDVEPENCTFSIHQKDREIYLSLTLKNEYIDSTFMDLMTHMIRKYPLIFLPFPIVVWNQCIGLKKKSKEWKRKSI